MNNTAITFAAILGAIVGSFAVATAWRLPRGLSWVTGRSSCPQCGSPLAVRDLVPLLSWVASAGKSRCCGDWISWRYPLGEVAGAAAFALSLLLLGPRPEVLSLFILWGFLAVISLVDLSHRYIPDSAVVGIWLAGMISDCLGLFVPVSEGLMASGGVAAAILLVRYAVGRRVGREAMGLGDVKLLAATGPWVGLQGMPILVFISAGLALLIYPLWRRRGGTEMPFGPAIAVAFYLTACGFAS